MKKKVLSNAKYLEKVAIMKHSYPSFSIKKVNLPVVEIQW
jgi:hypothetical protein